MFISVSYQNESNLKYFQWLYFIWLWCIQQRYSSGHCKRHYSPRYTATRQHMYTVSPFIIQICSKLDAREICVPPLLLHGIVDPVKSQYKSQDVIKIVCKDGFELENPQSGLLYCTQKGLWKVFTLGEPTYIPLPRCIGNHNELQLSNYFFTCILCFTVKERCPPLPPLMQGSMQVQVQFPIIKISYEIVFTGFFVLDIQEGGVNGLATELSSTRAVYQCWYGLELQPPESEIRYCVQGKWTGENPQCGNINVSKLYHEEALTKVVI